MIPGLSGRANDATQTTMQHISEYDQLAFRTGAKWTVVTGGSKVADPSPRISRERSMASVAGRYVAAATRASSNSH